MALNKRDTGFCRFVSGNPHRCSGDKFLDELRAKRTEATLKSGASPTPAGGSEQPLFEEVPTAAVRKRQRKEVATKQSEGELPPTIVVSVPKIQDPDGNEVGPLVVKVLPSVCQHSIVWVELSAEVLAYVRAAMLVSETKAPTPREVSEGGVRWRADRKRYLAERCNKETGQKKQRSFKPADASDEAKHDAKLAALAWVSAPAETDEPGDGAQEEVTEGTN